LRALPGGLGTAGVLGRQAINSPIIIFNATRAISRETSVFKNLLVLLDIS
jgi:hypothetical protein